MRWNYADPAGKLFISDGKYLYLYTPSQNRAEKMKMKETDDLRAPLAFLLGKLDFSRDFSGFQSKPAGNDLQVSAQPKSDKLPYQQVDFVVGPDAQIKRLNVVGHDNSILAFNFENEVVNPAVDDSMFKFVLPPGTAFIDTAEPRGFGQIAVAEFLLKYADPRGEIRSQVAEAASESEARERFTQQGFLVYSVRPRAAVGVAMTAGLTSGGAQEARHREVPDLQSAVPDPDPSRVCRS